MRTTSLIFSVSVLLAQAPKEPVIRTTATEVLLDVVVRDKAQHLVRDLKPEDIEVFEDGVRQQIRTFKFVDGRQVVKTEAAAAATERPVELNPAREINLISIIFGGMDVQMQQTAHRAAREFLEQQTGPNTYGAVFHFGYRLNVIQPYTNDPDLLRKAVDRAVAPRVSRQLGRESRTVEQRLGVGNYSPEWSARDAGREPKQADTKSLGGFFSGRMDQMLRNMLAANSIWDSYQRSMFSLLAINQMIEELAEFHGRKTVFFISTGIPGDPDTREILRMAISNANRGHVTIYALDPRGLTTTSPTAHARAIVNEAIEQTPQSVENRGLDPRTPSAMGSSVRAFDLARAALFSNPQAILRDLAESTGGFMVWDTNEFRKSMRQIFADVNTHYELSYIPAKPDFDGGWRTITVNVNRPRVTVQTRTGYFALPLLFGRSLMPFEMQTLKALDTRPLPRQFDYTAAAVRFRPGAESVQHALVIEVPVRNLEVVEDPAAKICRARVSVTALIKDAKGEIINKISRDLPRTVPLDRIEDLRRENVTITAPFALPPGRYTLETALIDRATPKLSAGRSALIVPGNTSLGLSEISLVRRVTPLEDLPSLGDPFQSSAGRVTPALANRVSAVEFSLYALVYPAASASAQPEVMIEIQQDGKTIARAPVSLRPADESGALPLLVTIPTAKLAPGDYEAHITARQGTLVVQEMIAVTVGR